MSPLDILVLVALVAVVIWATKDTKYTINDREIESRVAKAVLGFVVICAFPFLLLGYWLDRALRRGQA